MQRTVPVCFRRYPVSSHARVERTRVGRNAASRLGFRGFLLCLFFGLLLSGLSGCGCWKDPLAQNQNNNDDTKAPQTLEEMEARRRELREQREEKDDFETIRLTVLPSDDAPTKNHVKSGHWFSAVQTMKANNFDYPKGQLEAQCVDTRGNPIPLPDSDFDLSTARPVNLPKGQAKHFDLLLFANTPPRGGKRQDGSELKVQGGAINFMTRLRPRGGGREVDWAFEATTRMKPFQNHFIVLSDVPDKYQFLKTLRSVKPQRASDEFLSTELDYFVKLPKGTRRIDVPSHPLTWTNTAYVLWDDFDPEIMTPEQQQSMIDWIHWGGQIIINGPRTLDRLANSVMTPYLPARAESVGKITDDQIMVLNERWSFTDAKPLQLPTKDEERPLALKLELTEDASFLSTTGELVAEKRVGRGRIVATAFNLPHSYFQDWDSYDCFFNACLLGRPPRSFYRNDAVEERWAGTALTRDDPRLTSTVRYFTRDAAALTSSTRASATTRLGDASRLGGSFAVVPISATRPRRSIPSVRVKHPNMPIGSSQGPGVDVDIVGTEVIEDGTEAAYKIRFQNSGIVPLTSVRLIVEVSPELQPVRATDGFVFDEDRQQLIWRTEQMMQETGNTLELVCAAADNRHNNAARIDVQIVCSHVQQDDVLHVDIAAPGVRHQLDRTAKQSYAVNGFAKSDLIGVAGWNDKSHVSQEAGKALQQAAGISVPSIEFIAKVLGIYLVVLVPLNWLIFRLMGRVEWAWAAVPVIAIGGTIGVLKAAQLDIGFARSRTEIAIIELQPNYNRGHVTRYIGFFTSLASSYHINGEEDSTLFQPFASSPVGKREVALNQDDQVGLSGFSIVSNSTGLVHSEHMQDVGGRIDYRFENQQHSIQNNTQLNLKGCAIVQRNGDGVSVAWVGEVQKQEKRSGLQFVDLETKQLDFPEWENSPATSTTSVEGELNVRRLIEIATDPKRIGIGEVVLVGWNDELVPGVTATPDASQVTACTLVVAQLSHADRPLPQRDENSFAVLNRLHKADKQSDTSL